MTTDEYVYAPAPPAPPKRAELISPDLQAASRHAAKQGPPTKSGLAPLGSPKVRPYRDTKIPSARARLMMNRFAWGYDRRTFVAMRRAGGPNQWFEDQLRPTKVRDPQGSKYNAWYPDRLRSAENKWSDVFAGRKGQWDYAVDLANWTLLVGPTHLANCRR